jgi:hypothetical protein
MVRLNVMRAKTVQKYPPVCVGIHNRAFNELINIKKYLQA